MMLVLTSYICVGRSYIASYLFLTHTVAKQLIIVLISESGIVGLEISVCSVGGTVVVSWSSSVDSLLDLIAVFFILSLPDDKSYIWYGSKVVGLMLFVIWN